LKSAKEREGGRERGREGEISDIKKAPLLRRAALKTPTQFSFRKFTGKYRMWLCSDQLV
jgi:hypothetical protein